MFKLI